MKKLKIAIIHDFLTARGGAERVLEVFCEIFPEAPIYTLLYDKDKMGGRLEGKKIHTSFLQKLPGFLRKRRKYLLPLLPVVPETFDLREYDLVITSSGAWTKGIITRLSTVHIAYIHSPMRFAWDVNEEYLRQQKKNFLVNFFTRKILNYVRVWDKAAADRPDYLIANSEYTRKRIKKYYGRDSRVIYPPADIRSEIRNTKQTQKQGDADDKLPFAGYFLIVSRLSPYKKIDAAIEAFNKLELPLLIVGEGPQEKYLRSISKENVKFAGFLPDEKMPKIYQGARALLFPGVDDFGLSLAEAMSCGVPVIALKKGGSLEIVEEGRTGEFFDASVPEVIADAVRRFVEKEKSYEKKYIQESANKFSKSNFIHEIKTCFGEILKNENQEFKK